MREERHGTGQGDPSDHDAAATRSQPPSGRHPHTGQKRPGPRTCGALSLPGAALEECRLFSKPRWHLKLLRAGGWQPEARLQPPGKSCLAFPRPPLCPPLAPWASSYVTRSCMARGPLGSWYPRPLLRQWLLLYLLMSGCRVHRLLEAAVTGILLHGAPATHHPLGKPETP